MNETCPHCNAPRASGKLFCPECGKSFLGESIEPADQDLLAEAERRESAGSATNAWVAITILFLLIGAFTFLFGGHIFPFRHSHRDDSEDRKRSCHRNLRLIMGAVEKYNHDHSFTLDRITHSDTQEGGLLATETYLGRSVYIYLPGPTCYYSGENLLGTGTIICAEHGAVE